MEFRILGPLEVERNGATVAIPGHRQRALLALLLLRANEVVSTDRIVDELWGEDPPRTATTSLQNGVGVLRRLLGSDVLLTRAPGYVLRIDAEQLDAARFRRLLEDARRADAAERAELLRDALGLWRGTPLADLEFDSFVQSHVRRLEELRLTALEERIAADLELGRHGEVAAELEELVRDHPLRESFRGQLMLALYRSGRQADALAAYQDARLILAEELGIDPGPALQKLHGAILRQERAIDGNGGVRRVDANDQLEDVVQALLGGRLVVVLGCDSTALAAHLTGCFEPPDDELPGLAGVAEYVSLMHGSGPLHDELRNVLGRAAPGTAHHVLAGLVPALRQRGARSPLIATTAYDLALEQALLAANEEFDVVTYVAAGRDRGRFCHVDPDRVVRVVDVPNKYASELSLDRRPIVLRLAGGLDTGAAKEPEGFVVTEDDFIDYLAETPLTQAIPVGLVATLRRSHLLFLGFGVREWGLRTVLARVWGGGQLRYRSWAVVPVATPRERRAWHLRGVDLIQEPLDDYLQALGRSFGLSVERAA